MSTRSERPRIDDIPHDITPREVAYEVRVNRWEDEDIRLFVRNAMAITGLIRWAGPSTVILLIIIATTLIIQTYGIEMGQ